MSRASIEIPVEISWSKPFDYYNGNATITTRTDKYKWSRKMVKVHFREDANQAIIDAKMRGKFTGEYGASWEVVTAKASVEYELSVDITNTVNSVTRDEVKEEIEESGVAVLEGTRADCLPITVTDVLSGPRRYRLPFGVLCLSSRALSEGEVLCRWGGRDRVADRGLSYRRAAGDEAHRAIGGGKAGRI
ncbi:hypothetical protein BDV37DRAFT_289507 [Aspergillus pseudonomiae]|uniref:Uncharacterized protein n=1 Tax=Aspergillus pseudonomiae TaxID=1506151 RepID=A0A5N7CUK7_9EURO|nr:uncharacterized protein BDV37DRAFT_289507 [Aspergillus pseudonomiae]KAE8397338.1 hypothetical protein BDV37DRAFT_289507 [Aspergillus pseudonomiae]